jgi:hypothetical protein
MQMCGPVAAAVVCVQYNAVRLCEAFQLVSQYMLAEELNWQSAYNKLNALCQEEHTR